MNLATMETALNQIQGTIYGDRDRPIGLVSRVDTLETYIAAQKSNRWILIGIALGVAADVLVNLLS